MTAEIVDLGARRPVPNPGNGAREALIDIAEDLPDILTAEAALWAYWLLGKLWERGFKIVPLTDADME